MEVTQFTSVYGPVKSWRYGTSLGIDPIGLISTCSFNCVYCQLGEIECQTCDRAIYVPTAKIIEDLQPFTPWDVDIITISGSGEPTLAANLGEILQSIKTLTQRPTLVLTNATLLDNPQVRQDLALADQVSAKIDAVTQTWLQRINHPVGEINCDDILRGLGQFRSEYTGKLGIQTMILHPWSDYQLAEYIRLISRLSPDIIHINTPTRPKPQQRQLEGRGNHSPLVNYTYPAKQLKCVDSDTLNHIAQHITEETQIPVKWVSQTR